MMFGYGGIYDIIFVVPFLILSLYAQSKVQSTFAKYKNVRAKKGITANEVVSILLKSAGIYDVQIEHIRGNLSDHYDPRAKVIRLSDSVYGNTSLSAIAVAAHETGHAVQHHESYAPLNLRSAFVPIANIGSQAAIPLIMLGFFLGGGGSFLVTLGILMFSAAVIFQLITLPVEFNASSRAIRMMEENGVLAYDESDGAKKVLNAAALTYVAAAAAAVGQLLKLIMIYGRDD